MAQKSKKEHIIQTALPLFLKNGFKATSIDLVVKKSQVSKPTVYNHFPDKAALMLAVTILWVEQNQPEIAHISSQVQFENLIPDVWLNPETVEFFALVIGEGRRFPLAKKVFWEKFDQPWRIAFIKACGQVASFDQEMIELILDKSLLTRLRQL